MENLIKIRDLVMEYNISARTLRYYEDVGLIQSRRLEEHAYRFYDEKAVQRLQQILILRKLNISVRDIKRIFSASDLSVLLSVLSDKVNEIDHDTVLLNELKEIVLEFIHQIEQSDFQSKSDVKLLYEKARNIELKISGNDYRGNAASINRLLEVTEKLDRKIPDIMIVRIPSFRAVASGKMSFEALFGGEFVPWIEAHQHLFLPILFQAPDFLCAKDNVTEWLWRIKDDVCEKDLYPYSIVDFDGGLYAVAVSQDADDESNYKVIQKIHRWLEDTNFVIDNERWYAGHMIYAEEEIYKGLGYHQMNLYIPIKLKEE